MIDYYNFNYDNKKEVNKVLEQIEKKLDSYTQFRKINYTDKGLPEFNLPFGETNLRKNIAGDYGKEAEIFFSKDRKKPDDWDELGIVHRAKELKNAVIELSYTDENKQTKLKRDKVAENLVIETNKCIKDIQEQLMFLLALRAKIIEELDYCADENIRRDLFKKSNYYYARIDDLIAAEDVLKEANAAILISRDLKDPDRDLKSKWEVETDITNAQYLLEQAEHPTVDKYKNKRELLFDLCSTYSKLNDDKNLIDKVIDVTRALITKELSEYVTSDVNRAQFIEKIKENGRNLPEKKANNIYKYLDERKLRETTQKFFRDDELLSSTEKLAYLQALRLSTINTMEELKDYLLQSRNEITMRKTKDGKVEISIGRIGAVDDNISYDGKTESENKNIGANGSITYIYDPYNREVEGYKLAGQAYLFSKDMKSEVGRNLTNQFNIFLGNLEASTNVSILTILNAQVPVVKDTSIEANVAKFKNKLTAKIKDVELDLDVVSSAGTIKVNGLSIKPSALNLSISPAISTNKYNFKGFKITSTISNVFKEGASLSDKFATKIATAYFNASMKGLAEDLTMTFGKEDSSIVSFNFDNSNGKLQLESTKDFLEDKKELFNKLNENIAFMRAVITKDSNLINNYISKNSDKVSNDFQNKSRISQLLEAGNIARTSLLEVKNLLKAIIEDIHGVEENTKNIKKGEFSALLNKFRKDEEIFTINSATTIDNSLIDEKLSLLLTLNLDAADLKQIFKLLEKVNEPEKYYSEIRTAIINNEQEAKDYLQATYSKVMTKRIEDLIKKKDRDAVCRISRMGGFKNEIADAFKNVKKMTAVVFLSDVEQNAKTDDKKSLDDEISKYRKNIDKFQEKNTNIQTEHTDR